MKNWLLKSGGELTGGISYQQRVTDILRHIKKVEDNCNVLSRKLWDTEPELALKLIRLGRLHDLSKLESYELQGLYKESSYFNKALAHHHGYNPHHPEHWESIHNMADEYIAEMVCDVAARGQEFGTDVREWFKEIATKKYGFDYVKDPIGKKIEKYLSLLLSTPFS